MAERNTINAIIWALGGEEHAAEEDSEEYGRVMGEAARRLAREHIGEMTGQQWCKIKHALLSYGNTLEQIGKRIREGEDYEELANHRDVVSEEINDLIEGVLEGEGEPSETD